MRKYRMLAAVTAAVCAALTVAALTKPVTVDVVTLAPRTAVKTDLFPAVVTDGTHLQMFIRESRAAAVKPGQTATVSGVGFAGESYAGTVTAVAPAATVKNGKTGILGTVTLTDTDDSIKKGLTATVRVTVETIENALVVQDEWLGDDGGTPFLWVVADGRAVRRAVVLGETVDSGTLQTGVFAGEAVITDPHAVTKPRRVRERGAP